MVDFARRYLVQLIESVIAPIWAWVMARSWGIRAGILVVIVSIIGSAQFPAVPNAFYQEAYSLRRVFFAPSGTLPLKAATISLLRDTDRRLSSSVAGDLIANKLNGVTVTPWAAAQAVVALGGAKDGRVNSDEIVAFLRANTAQNCACWTEIPAERNAAPGVFISGWIMAALAELGVPVSQEEIDYVLSKQDQREGWWSTFSDSSQYQYASAYTTAWIIIGLAEQRRRELLGAEDTKRATSAIAQAANWLLQHRGRNNARWKPYPNLASASESESISGLVVHALHISGAVPTNEVDKEWLDNLPEKRIAASDVENNYLELKGPTRVLLDHFVQIKLPWVLIATGDAYESGDVWEKGKALRWIETNISDKGVTSADANENNWWRAELRML